MRAFQMDDIVVLDNVVRVCTLWAFRKGNDNRRFVWYIRDIIVHSAIYCHPGNEHVRLQRCCIIIPLCCRSVDTDGTGWEGVELSATQKTLDSKPTQVIVTIAVIACA